MSAPDPAAAEPAVSPGRGADPALDLRRLTRDDVPHLVRLERELFASGAWSPAMLREELTAPGRWYVGVDDPSGGLMAYGGLWFDGDAATVMTLGVAGSAQRRGLGARVLAALVDRARALGADAVLLEVRVDNDPAIALYRAAGFEVLARRRRYYQPEDVDAWTMRLVLASGAAAGDGAGPAYPGHHG